MSEKDEINFEFSDEELDSVIDELEADDPEWDDESIEESFGDFFEALTITGRRKKGIVARRYRQKLSRSKGIKARRFASPKHLQRRARQAAIKAMRQRVAGHKGTQYKKLSYNDKANIDKRVHDKRATVHKLAARMMPKIKAKELQRLRKLRSRKGKSKRTIGVRRESTNLARGIIEAVDSMSAHLEKDRMNTMFSESYTEKDDAYLKERALSSNIPFDVAKQVYDRGIDEWTLSESDDDARKSTPQQHAFNRLNAFAEGGDVDSDLAQPASIMRLDYVVETMRKREAFVSAKTQFEEQNTDDATTAQRLGLVISIAETKEISSLALKRYIETNVNADVFAVMAKKNQRTPDEIFDSIVAKEEHGAGETAEAGDKYARETPGQKPKEKTVVDGEPTKKGEIKKPHAADKN